MKFFNQFLVSLSIASLAACGTIDQNANIDDALETLSSSELAE
ncbi:MAG: hypothetical protein RJB13_209 [Pseudomonadota bacterium]|jgi:hypothetical protein